MLKSSNFHVGVERGSKGLFEEQIPWAFCCGHSSRTGRLFVKNQAMMSQSIKEHES